MHGTDVRTEKPSTGFLMVTFSHPKTALKKMLSIPRFLTSDKPTPKGSLPWRGDPGPYLISKIICEFLLVYSSDIANESIKSYTNFQTEWLLAPCGRVL